MPRANGFRLRRRAALALIGGTTAILTTGVAWACVAVVSLTASPASIAPGASVAVTGRDFAPGAPIEIHLDSPTGRLLGTQSPHNQSVMMNSWTLNVPIPADVPAGQHILVAIQDYHNHNAGTPARAMIAVGQSAPPAAVPAARPATLDVSQGQSGASLALVALGVAVVALLVAGLWSMAASRRRPEGAAR